MKLKIPKRLGALIAAAPDLGLGAFCLVTWIDPYRFGEKTVAYVCLLMLLEFIIVHSTGFMGAIPLMLGKKRKQLAAVLGLALFYTLFAGAFSLAFKQWWPLVSFWLLTLNRMAGLLLGQAPKERETMFLMASWAVSVFLYLVGVGITSVVPVPALGITPEVIARQELSGGGLWIEEPFRVVAFGFLYFTGVGLCELIGYAWGVARPERGTAC